MTLHADRVAPLRREFGGIYDWTLAIGGVGCARSVTTFTGNAAVGEWLSSVEILGSVFRRIQSASMAVQAIRKSWQRHGDLPRFGVSRRHVPARRLRIPVDRRFKKKAFLGEKKGLSLHP